MDNDDFTRQGMRQKAKERRAAPTGAEAVLRLALKQAGEGRIRRQLAIGRVIIDLAIPSRNLIIETDGPWKSPDRERDARRDAWLRSLGFTVLRFTNPAVLSDPQGVAAIIQQEEPSEFKQKRFHAACRTARATVPQGVDDDP